MLYFFRDGRLGRPGSGGALSSVKPKRAHWIAKWRGRNFNTNVFYSRFTLELGSTARSLGGLNLFVFIFNFS